MNYVLVVSFVNNIVIINTNTLFTVETSFIQRDGRMVRWCWVNFQCRDVLQFGLQ